MRTQKKLLASFAGRKFRTRRRAAPRFRPARIYTAEEQRLLDSMVRAHGEGGQAWVEEYAELILDQAYAIGDL
jgi:hypothetical protein